MNRNANGPKAERQRSQKNGGCVRGVITAAIVILTLAVLIALLATTARGNPAGITSSDETSSATISMQLIIVDAPTLAQVIRSYGGKSVTGVYRQDGTNVIVFLCFDQSYARR